jgi:hypothetical protein
MSSGRDLHEVQGSAAAQPGAVRWQQGRAAGLVAGLLLLERGLAGAAGTPIEQLRVPGQLVQARPIRSLR